MRDVHIVGVSDDGHYLLLGAQPDADRATGRLRVDDRLTAALRGRLGRPGQGPAESALSPKEFQARLRAGQTPEQVARVAGVPVARVERYAGPVESERALMIEGARAATLERARRGPSVVPLGEAVDVHLAAMPGLKAESVHWSARRRDDGRWVVVLSFATRGRAKTAEWTYDPARRAVEALDGNAAGLGHVAADRPAPSRRAPRAPRAARPGPRRPARKRATATKRAKPAPAATPTRAKKATKKATKKAAKKATKKAVKKAVKKATKKKATTSVTTAKRTRRTATAKPAAPQPLTTGIRERGPGRASVPAWQDVLLGIRPAAAETNGRAEANGGRRSAGASRSRRRA